MDRRRNAGPEVSVRPLPDPLVYPDSANSTEVGRKGGKVPVLDPVNYTRRDGRYPEQLRPPLMKTGIVSRAPGSVYMEVGGTKLVCAVYGPRSPTSRAATRTFQTLGNVSCEILYAPFSATARLPHQPEAEEEDYSLLLLQAIVPAIRRDLFPNSFVDITITVLEQGGSLLAAACTAASIALVQAGVEMYDSVVACGAVLVPSAGLFLMDPDNGEERDAEGAKLVVAVMPNLGQVTQLHLVGEVEGQVLVEALSLAVDGVIATYENAIKPLLESL